MNDCKSTRAKLPALMPDLLLDPKAIPAVTAQHLEACPECRATIDSELSTHRAMMQLLDSWEAPEVSPYFDSRMTALLREEQRQPRLGLLGRARNWLLMTNLHMKSVAGAAALGLLLAVGGGAYLDLSQQPPPQQASATVQDLQSLDDNSQVFQQMSSLDSGDDDSASGSTL